MSIRQLEDNKGVYLIVLFHYTKRQKNLDYKEFLVYCVVEGTKEGKERALPSVHSSHSTGKEGSEKGRKRASSSVPYLSSTFH